MCTSTWIQTWLTIYMQHANIRWLILTHTHTHTHCNTHSQAHTHSHAHTLAYTHTQTHARTHTHTHTHTLLNCYTQPALLGLWLISCPSVADVARDLARERHCGQDSQLAGGHKTNHPRLHGGVPSSEVLKESSRCWDGSSILNAQSAMGDFCFWIDDHLVLFSALLSRLTALACGATWVISFL